MRKYAESDRTAYVAMPSSQPAWPVRGVSRDKRILMSVGFASCAVVSIILFAQTRDAWSQVVWITLALFSAYGMSLLLLSRSWEPLSERIRYLSGSSLHIGYRRSLTLLICNLFGSALALLFGVAGAYFTFRRLADDPGYGAVAPFRVSTWAAVLIPMSLCFAFIVCRSWRLPTGAKLARETLFVRELAAWKQISWREVDRAEVELGRYGILYLVLPLRNGEIVRSSAQALGSDPNVVAAIIRFYLEHPEHRDALKDSEEALRRFRSHVA